MAVYLARKGLDVYKQHVLEPVIKLIALPPTTAFDSLYLKEIQDYVMVIEGHIQPSSTLQIEILEDVVRFFAERRFNMQLSAHDRWLSWMYHKALRSARAGVL
jgi:hypothetical protein